jgi:hypothetical protein
MYSVKMLDKYNLLYTRCIKKMTVVIKLDIFITLLFICLQKKHYYLFIFSLQKNYLLTNVTYQKKFY